MVICSRIPDVIIDQLDAEGEEDPSALSRDTSEQVLDDPTIGGGEGAGAL